MIKISQRYNYQDNHKIINGVLYKRCAHHKKIFGEEKWFPCTSEYFYSNKSNSSDGLYSQCKKCSVKESEKWIKKHPERYNENRKRFFKTPKFKKWCYKNYLDMKDYHKQWMKDNKDKIHNYNMKHSCKKHQITKEQWAECKDYFNNECAYCGLKQEDHYIHRKGKLINLDLHKEHVVWNGANDLSNCVPSCQTCNSRKHTYALNEWYNENNINFTKERYDKIVKWITEDYKKFI